MKAALLAFALKFLLYIAIAGCILILLLYITYTDVDKILKKHLALQGYRVVAIEDTKRVFPVSPQKKPWSRFIRTRYGGATERITYRLITLLISGKEQTLLAAIYTAPFVSPQVFFEKEIQSHTF